MDRTLTLDLLDGRRTYEAVAHWGLLGDVVGLRLTGWDAGRVVTELVGEIPAADAFDVGGLLAATLSGFRDLGPPFPPDPPATDGPPRPTGPPGAADDPPLPSARKGRASGA
jgi:hypothetical protein